MSTYLVHHGIKGQRWGVRRFRNKDGTLTSAGKKRYHDEEEGSEEQKPKKSSSKKKYVAAGAAVAVTLLAAYGVYKFSKGGKFASFNTSLMLKPDNTPVKTLQNIPLLTVGPFKRKTNMSGSILDDVAAINPGFSNNKSRMNNCSHCTTAFEMRRRGFDVMASSLDPSRHGRKITEVEDFFEGDRHFKKFDPPGHDLQKMWDFYYDSYSLFNRDKFQEWCDKHPRPVPEKVNRDVAHAFAEKLKEGGNGSRGNVVGLWDMFSAHSMAYEVVDNKVKIFDCQTNKVFDDVYDALKDFKSDGLHWMRTDDLELNFDKLKGVVEDV